MMKEPIPTIVKLSLAITLIICIFTKPYPMHYIPRDFCFVGFIYLFIYLNAVAGHTGLHTILMLIILLYVPVRTPAWHTTGWIIADSLSLAFLVYWMYMNYRDRQKAKQESQSLFPVKDIVNN